VSAKNTKELIGTVVSNSMNKTIVAAIKRRVKHPLYGKVMNKTKKVKAHDENNEANVGDTVRLIETRPLSKDKRWRLRQIIAKKETVKKEA
jgi:small subunit ribosomal protein S17